MRVSEAVTDAGGLWFVVRRRGRRSTRCSARSAVLAVRILVRRDAEGEIADVDIPYGPPPPEPAEDRESGR